MLGKCKRSAHISTLLDGTKHIKSHDMEHTCAIKDLLRSLFSFRGSVIPRAMLFALPCACLAYALKEWQLTQGKQMHFLSNSAAYSGFSFAMGFLFVFRTSQAYSRYWAGVSTTHRLYAEWLEFASCIVAFTRFSKASAEATQIWHHRLARLLSLLHAVSSASLRGVNGSKFELIDLDGLDAQQLSAAATSERPTSLIFQWILELVIEGIDKQIVNAPPPIISRAFQELTSGMVAFHDAANIKINKFPFQYTQMASILLLVHWCITPFVMCQWITSSSWVFMFTLVQVLIFWGLHFTSVEIENPFKGGAGVQNAAAEYLQHDFNQQLLMMIDPRTRAIPQLSREANLDISSLMSDMNDIHDMSEIVSAASKELDNADNSWQGESQGGDIETACTKETVCTPILPMSDHLTTASDKVGSPSPVEAVIEVQSSWEVLDGGAVKKIAAHQRPCGNGISPKDLNAVYPSATVLPISSTDVSLTECKPGAGQKSPRPKTHAPSAVQCL
jgi:predicted membrane chloride channel (bestrophin family)